MATDQMIALDIIVSFCIFSLLKCDRIFGKNLGHDICGKVFDPALSGGQYQIWLSKFTLVFFFYDTFK